jgi:zinc D-Ala-D-Ala carboxypeptidase
MSLSLLRWSIVIFGLCLLASVAYAEEEAQSSVAKASGKEPAAKKAAASRRLVPIPGGRLLRHDAAAAFEQMHSMARAEGYGLWVISGHRTWEQQKYLYRLYRQGLGPRAARPGRSNHQRGTAVDISVGDERSPVYEWLAANACRFGFRRTVSSEPWHWEYRPRSTRAPKPGKDCQGRERPVPEVRAPAVPGASR